MRDICWLVRHGGPRASNRRHENGQSGVNEMKPFHCFPTMIGTPQQLIATCLKSVNLINEQLKTQSKIDAQLLHKLEKMELVLMEALKFKNLATLNQLQMKLNKLDSVLKRVLECSNRGYKKRNKKPLTSLSLLKMNLGFVSKLDKIERGIVSVTSGIASMKLKTRAKSIFTRGSNSTVFVPEIEPTNKPRSLSFSDESEEELQIGGGVKSECLDCAGVTDKIQRNIQELILNSGPENWRTLIPKLEKYSKNASIYSVGIGHVLVTGSCAVVSKQSFIHNSFNDCGIFSFLYPLNMKLPSPNLIGQAPKSCADAAQITFTRLKKLVPESYLTVFSVPKASSLPIFVGMEFTFHVLGDYITVAFMSVGALSNGSTPTKLSSKKLLNLKASLKSFNIWKKKVSGLEMSRYCVGQCIETGKIVMLRTEKWKNIHNGYLFIDSFWAFPSSHPGLRKLELGQDSDTTLDSVDHLFVL